MTAYESEVSHAFLQEIGQGGDSFNLARAALLFARSAYPNLDCGWYLGQLDLIAKDVSVRCAASASLQDRLETLSEYFFQQLGYSGNIEDYYDPRNSYLNEVIDRRIGIPITLSIVFLEISDRLGLDACGISFPGHFLIGVNDGVDELIVDAFDGGTALPRDVFLARLIDRADDDTPRELLESALRPAGKIEILLRQLRNLKAVYAQQRDVNKNLGILNHMLAVDPDLMPELYERARLYDSIGFAPGASKDYERVLELMPDGDERRQVEQQFRDAKSRAATLH